MLKRVMSALVALVVLIVILFLDPIIISACAIVLSLWCLFEAFSVFSYQKRPIFLAIGLLACIAAPMLGVWKINQIAGFAFLLLLLLAAVMVCCPKKISIIDIAVVSFLSVLIPISFSLLVSVRKLPDFGAFYLWLPFIGAFCTDTGAFFVGRAFGGRKLCEELSPKKTVSGSIGGILGSVVGFFIYSLVLRYGFDIRFHYISYFGLAVLSSVAAQLGDLTASALKRHANVKDFGNIMPGHGGMLDRVDSLMFSGPMVYIYLVTFAIPIFVR